MSDNRKDCCKNAANIELKPDHPDARVDLSVSVCRVCGCRHFELSVDHLALGFVGAPTG